jgi:hypothetical protein
MMCAMKANSRNNTLAGDQGSMTIEALLIVPVILFLLVLFLRWGMMLYEGLGAINTAQESAEAGTGVAGFGFLLGGPPARRIRDADLIVDVGKSIKELLPTWSVQK